MAELTFPPAPANPQPFSAGVHLQPQFDPLDLLPPAAAEKLRLLRQRASDAHALTVPFADQQEATQLKHAAELEVSRLTGHRSEGGYELPDDDGRVIRAREALAKASDD